MPIKIPDDAKVLKLDQLTRIAAVSQFVKLRIDALKDAVKQTMRRRDFTFAQSEFAVAHLRGGGGGQVAWINPKKVFKLTQKSGARKLTLDEFLKCVAVKEDALALLLSAEEIKAVTDTFAGTASEGRLYTEMKPNAVIDFDAIDAAIVKAVSGEPEGGGQLKRAA